MIVLPSGTTPSSWKPLTRSVVGLASPSLLSLAATAPAPKPSDPLADNPDVVAVEEFDNRTTTYSTSGSGTPVQVQQPADGPGEHAFKRFLRGFLLPQNYPESISPEYTHYRKWVGVQQFAGGALDFLATQGLLAGLGVHFSAPTVATMSYFSMNALDSFGQMAGATVARRVDVSPKKWYGNGEMVMATSRLALTSMILVPTAFFAVAPLANATKAFANTINGAAEANIDLHNSMGLNVGEMKAKNGNQNLVCNGLGTLTGLGISAVANHYGGKTGAMVAAGVLAVAEMTAARLAARTLRMHDLTDMQIRRLAHHELETGTIAAPDDLPRRLPGGAPRIQMGVGLREMTADRTRFDRLRGLYANDRYLLDYDGDKIRVALHQRSTPEDQARALHQAQLLSELIHSPGFEKQSQKLSASDASWYAVEASYAATPRDFGAHLAEVKKAGWEIGRIVTGAGNTRVRWRPVKGAAPQPLSLQEFKALMRG